MEMAAEPGSVVLPSLAALEKEAAEAVKLEEPAAIREPPEAAASLPGPAVPPPPARRDVASSTDPELSGPALDPPGARPSPETFRQRFRQFRYHEAAGPREAFRQLRELSRQWLRPDIRTKEQIVEMLVQEQLMAILPEEIRARRRGRRCDVRITG